jgi:hypothetical protein
MSGRADKSADYGNRVNLVVQVSLVLQPSKAVYTL